MQDEEDGMDDGMDDGMESDDDSDELEGMSLPSDSILSRPGVPTVTSASAAAAAPTQRPPKHPTMRSASMHPAPLSSGGGGGSKRGGSQHHHHPAVPQRYSGDDMAVSYHSPSSFVDHHCVMMGTSPGALVTYASPGGHSGGSPMQMTPVFSSLEHNMQSRLGQRL